MILEFLILIATVLGFHYVYLLWNKDYWEKRGIFCPKSDLIMGNLPGQLTGKKNIYYELDALYQKYKKDHPYIGIYNFRSPILLVFDPEVLKDMTIKYFKYFQATEFFNKIDKKSDPLFGNHPFFLIGDAWKSKRAEISPAFSNLRIKALFPIMMDTCDKISKYIEKQNQQKDFEAFDAKNFSARYTISVVSAAVYSVDAAAFESSEDPELIKKTMPLLQPDSRFQINFALTSLYPILGKFWKVAFSNKESVPFFTNLMENAIKTRVENKIQAADYLDHLINLMNRKEIKMEDIAAHGATFLTDGYETSSVGISSALYELAKNKRVQDKLRNELLSAMPTKESFTYDNIMENEYLDQVWNESLRRRSPVIYIGKMCNESVEVELKGKKVSIDKGTIFYIPHKSIFLDPEHFEDPLEFKPERFGPENGGAKAFKERGTFFPFGDGPRVCVGMRFAVAQSKVAIAYLVRNFEITVNKKTADKFEIHPQAIIAQYTSPFWINFKKYVKSEE